jgi:iodotyrosine deiodinase
MPTFHPLDTYREYPAPEMIDRARHFAEEMIRRRTVREFSPRPVPRETIDHCLRAAASAPSGANQQPWHFVVVTDSSTKRQIREAAEIEEREFYGGRAPQEWLDALSILGTNEDKPFLEAAPYLIVIFAQAYGVDSQGHKKKHYYVPESVGIATGILITALHLSGLATLTHTPSPMNFLSTVLGRPSNERAFLILVAGYPSPTATVPAIFKKPFEEFATYFDSDTPKG